MSFVAKPSDKGYEYTVSDALYADSDPPTKELAEKVGRFVEEYIEAMEKVKLKQGLQIAMNICSEGNRYLQGSKFWKLYKVDRPRCSIVIKPSMGLVHLLALLIGTIYALILGSST